MRILFLSAQIPGHLDWGGYLPTAAELARRGHETLWASGSEVQPILDGAGVPFHPLTSTGWRWPPPPPLTSEQAATNAESLHQLKQVRALDQWLDVERVAQATEEIVVVCQKFQPDIIISEMFVSAAGLAAEKTKIPLIIAGWPAPSPPPAGPEPSATDEPNPLIRLARDRLLQLLSRFHLNGQYWTKRGPPALRSPLLHLTYWSPRWYEGLSFGAQTRHAGGTIPASATPYPADLPPPDHDPWVLITLGTSFNRDPNFFIMAAQAAKRMGCLPLVVFGADLAAPWIQQTIARMPESSIIRERVNFANILPHTAAAIHHGGAGTTHALVVHGVPQIVIPHAADQSYQARGVARAGVGLHIAPRNVTVETLVAGLSQLLPDRSAYRARARILQSEFHALGGVSVAADLIERAYSQTDSAQPPQRKMSEEDMPCKP